MTPGWLLDLLGAGPVPEGDTVELDGRAFVARDGILREASVLSASQSQTADMFGFKWQQRATFESPSSLARMRAWLVERYGDVAAAPWWDDHGAVPVVVDAGCGAGASAMELLDSRLKKVRYLGVDVSSAVDVAAARFREAGLDGGFLQADVTRLPLPPRSVDVVLSEGVMHHTDSTRAALAALAELVKPGGRFLFYVYRTKGPVREFTDDLIRDRLQGMAPQDAWNALLPLTRLGKALGDLGVEIDVPEAIDLLGIPAGPIDLQRLFYWHVCKAFHHPDLDVDELNHINYDWFAPRNAHRQTPDEVRTWCADAGLEIERERIEDAGITVVARRPIGG
jgi:arsenite methyltransferase